MLFCQLGGDGNPLILMQSSVMILPQQLVIGRNTLTGAGVMTPLHQDAGPLFVGIFLIMDVPVVRMITFKYNVPGQWTQ